MPQPYVWYLEQRQAPLSVCAASGRHTSPPDLGVEHSSPHPLLKEVGADKVGEVVVGVWTLPRICRGL